LKYVFFTRLNGEGIIQMKKLLTTILLFTITTVCYAKVYSVEGVIDGNTIKFSNGETVRLIAVDCPDADTKKGQEAIGFVRGLVKGKEVQLEHDIEKRDEDGRLLAYVWYEISPFSHKKDMVWSDYYEVDFNKWKNKQGYYGTFVHLNATIIKAGYATPRIIPPNVKYADLFKKLYQEARELKRGLRGACSLDKECLSMDCSGYDNEVKSGYHPYCVDGRCKCMCYGCE